MNYKNLLNHKTLTATSAVIIIFITYLFLAPEDHQAESFVEDSVPKAAIIDQLYEEFPGDHFHEQAKYYLEMGGYQVDIIKTNQVTVDFYKKLAQKNYKFVIVRTHGVADDTNENAMLFTGERYIEDKYISEQLFGHVQKGAPLLDVSYAPEDSSSSEWKIVNDTYRVLKSPVKKNEQSENEYFVITPKFVNDAMDGKFHDTVFLLGGCSTVANPSLAEALIKKGASTVVGWDDTIGNRDNDTFMIKILKHIIEDDMQVDKAVDTAMESFVNHPPNNYFANLKSYSQDNI